MRTYRSGPRHRRRLSVWGTGAKFSWTHRRRKGSVVRGHHGECGAQAYNGYSGGRAPGGVQGQSAAPGHGVRRAKAESISVIWCPTKPANLAPLVKFSKYSCKVHFKNQSTAMKGTGAKRNVLVLAWVGYRGEVLGCPGGVGAYGPRPQTSGLVQTWIHEWRGGLWERDIHVRTTDHLLRNTIYFIYYLGLFCSISRFLKNFLGEHTMFQQDHLNCLEV